MGYLVVMMMIEDKVVSGSLQLGKTGWYLSAKTENGYSINFNYVKLPNLTALGISSVCADQQFVLFMDFDRITEMQLRSQLNAIYRDWNVTHFFIFKTGYNRYHVISLEKFELSMVERILENTLVDYSFKRVAISSDSGWILRVQEKKDRDGNIIRDRPEFFDCMILARKPYRRLSRAHIEAFSLMHFEVRQIIKEMGYFDESHWDTNTDVRMIRYGTSNENVRVEHDLPLLSNSKKLKIIYEDHLSL